MRHFLNMTLNTKESRKNSNFDSVCIIFYQEPVNGSLKSFGSGGIITSSRKMTAILHYFNL